MGDVVSMQPHSVCIYDRQRVELTGVSEVDSFNDSGIVLITSFGEISIEGEDLKIDSFSVETGKVSVVGKITGLYYYEKNKSVKSGFFSRRSK